MSPHAVPGADTAARREGPATIGRAAVAAVALALASCAADDPNRREATERVVAPFETREECLDLATGDRLDWWFEADTPVNFDIRYREGPAVLIPFARDGVRTDAGIFVARLPHRYCGAWESGPGGAFLAFRLRNLGPAKAP